MYDLVANDAELGLPGVVPVIGQASLWGRVISCTDGWRAQYAYPYSLRVPDGNVAAKLIRRYGVEVEVT